MGIDWGMGVTNIDHGTGIRFGVIGINKVSADALDDNGEYAGVNYEGWKKEVERILRSGFTDGWGLGVFLRRIEPYAGAEDKDVEWLTNAIGVARREPGSISMLVEEGLDLYADGYGVEACDELWEMAGEGYDALQVDETDIFVRKSPWVTRAIFCSPCAPGAGSLGSCATAYGPAGELMGDCWAYCLGEEFFDEHSPMPYQALSASSIDWAAG